MLSKAIPKFAPDFEDQLTLEAWYQGIKPFLNPKKEPMGLVFQYLTQNLDQFPTIKDIRRAVAQAELDLLLAGRLQQNEIKSPEVRNFKIVISEGSGVKL